MLTDLETYRLGPLSRDLEKSRPGSSRLEMGAVDRARGPSTGLDRARAWNGLERAADFQVTYKSS